MKKQELIEALKMLVDALEESGVHSENVEAKEEPKAEPKEEPKKAEKKSVANAEFNGEDLQQMKYADLKKLASDLGVSAKGKRDEIIARILAEEIEVSVEENEPETEESNVVYFPKKKEEVDYLALAKEATDGMSLDEIREVLEDLELDSEGKKKDLIDRIAKAMEEGIIEIEDEDDEEVGDDDTDEVDEEEDEEESEDDDEEDEDDEDDSDDEDDEDEDDDEDDEEIDENSYFEEFDDGANDPEDVDSEERAKAMVKLQKEIIADYENEALQDKDIDEFLKKALTEDEYEDLEDADEMDKFMAYCEFMKRMIDDDGERIPMGEPYEITVDGDVYDYCCGHELEETDEGYVCEVCGATYEAE